MSRPFYSILRCIFFVLRTTVGTGLFSKAHIITLSSTVSTALIFIRDVSITKREIIVSSNVCRQQNLRSKTILSLPFLIFQFQQLLCFTFVLECSRPCGGTLWTLSVHIRLLYVGPTLSLHYFQVPSYVFFEDGYYKDSNVKVRCRLVYIRIGPVRIFVHVYTFLVLIYQYCTGGRFFFQYQY